MRNLKIFFISFILFLSCAHAQSEQKAKVQSPQEVLDKFWEIAKLNIYPKSLEKKFFTEEEYVKLKEQAKDSSDLYSFAPDLNNFLNKLNISHTHFYTDQDLEFYFFRSLFSTRDPEYPKTAHIGAEYIKTDEGYIVKAVLDGFPAQQAGIKRGDILLSLNNEPFHPVLSFKKLEGTQAKISILRGIKKIEALIKVSHTGLHRSYIDSIQNSVRVIDFNNMKIGYVHLWTGTHGDSVKKLQNAIRKLKNTEAIILDLRDGYGGAWWDHLDPFYENTNQYFKATWIDRGGVKTEMLPKSKMNLGVYTKPMVVLINEGVRSGKEALAFHFKNTKRAVVVGTKTAGFFVAGGAYFNDSELPYFLYLSSKGLLLDG
ncbi:MAG: S41 family peptidase, partial [Bdellovibrionales bacterium]